MIQKKYKGFTKESSIFLKQYKIEKMLLMYNFQIKNINIHHSKLIKYFTFDLSGANDTHDEDVMGIMSKSYPSAQGNDESIGIGFFAFGFIILIIGLIILCIINRVF